MDEERHKHAVDTAQGDDVTYMLEKQKGELLSLVSSFRLILLISMLMPVYRPLNPGFGQRPLLSWSQMHV